MNKQTEIELLNIYFNNIETHTDTIKNETIIRCYNSFNKESVGYNHYRFTIGSERKIVIVQGHYKQSPYEHRYYYEDIEHLERIIKESHLQNCLYYREERKL